MATRTPEFVALIIVAVVEKVSAISGLAISRDVLVEVTTKQIQLTVKRMRPFCQDFNCELLLSSLSRTDATCDSSTRVFGCDGAIASDRSYVSKDVEVAGK